MKISKTSSVHSLYRSLFLAHSKAFEGRKARTWTLPCLHNSLQTQGLRIQYTITSFTRKIQTLAVFCNIELLSSTFGSGYTSVSGKCLTETNHLRLPSCTHLGISLHWTPWDLPLSRHAENCITSADTAFHRTTES